MISLQPASLFAMFALCAPVLADGFDPWTQSARYELEYRVDLGRWAGAKTGSVRVWIPLAADNGHQRVHSEDIESPWTCQKTQDGLRNRFVYLEPGGVETASGQIVLRLVVERSPSRGVPKSAARAGTPLDPQRYLKRQRHIPLDGKIRELAERASGALKTDAEKIRVLYDYIGRTMRYSKQGVGWGRGDALWACEAKYGNCTDFHSVFIGLARTQSIPARFVIGFPIPADKAEATIGGYHCWAEVYDRARGWLPLDASEAWKSKRFDDYFGRIPSDRIEFTVGRDILLEPPQQGEPLNFFVYPYVEVDGKPVEQVSWKLRVRRLTPTKAGG